jgi:antitoxin HicB
MTNNNPHIGSSFDEFLDEENLLVEANEIAIKRVIAWQLQQEIESN